MTIAELLKHDFEKGSLRLYDSNGNKIYTIGLGSTGGVPIPVYNALVA